MSISEAENAYTGRERGVTLVLAALQFVIATDSMLMMPLGPDLAAQLGIPTSKLGVLGSAYTFAAAASGVLGSIFLDRFARRPAMLLFTCGLAGATGLAALSQSFGQLILARLAAGACGGPATSLALAAVGDAVPAARRGKAMSTLMLAFAAASILGVPAGLELSRNFGWRSSFRATAVLECAVVAAAFVLLPALRTPERARSSPFSQTLELLANASVQRALVLQALLTIGHLALMPNLSSYLLHNLGLPRTSMSQLYLVGGVVSVLAMNLAGWSSDRYGPAVTTSLSTAVYVGAIFVIFVQPSLGVSVSISFALLMASSTSRMVAIQALTSRVPRASQRARFMSAQSSVQHLFGALGAFLSATVLSADSDGKLSGIDAVAIGSMLFGGLSPWLLAGLNARMKRDGHSTLPFVR